MNGDIFEFIPVHLWLNIYGFLGFRVVMPRFGGERGVPHPAHPQIWEAPRQVPKSHIYLVFVLIPNRAEDINDFDRFIKGAGFVLYTAGDNVHISGLEQPSFIIDGHLHLALDDSANLFVGMAVKREM